MNLMVEFIYDSECPNVREARGELIKAFTKNELPPKWTEWDRNSKDSPPYAKKFGSPTILVNGKDIGGAEESDANCCRVYSIDGRLRGVPSSDFIAKKMKLESSEKGAWKSMLAALPSFGLVILPKLTCAACWPAYAGILSSMGIGFINYTDYLLPVTAIALLVSLIALGYRAARRRGYGPFLVGLASSLVILVARFQYDSDLVTYLGISSLLAASIWNSWPSKKSNFEHCSSCN